MIDTEKRKWMQWNPANNIAIINYIIYVSYYIVPPIIVNILNKKYIGSLSTYTYMINVLLDVP